MALLCWSIAQQEVYSGGGFAGLSAYWHYFALAVEGHEGLCSYHEDSLDSIKITSVLQPKFHCFNEVLGGFSTTM